MTDTHPLPSLISPSNREVTFIQLKFHCDTIISSFPPLLFHDGNHVDSLTAARSSGREEDEQHDPTHPHHGAGQPPGGQLFCGGQERLHPAALHQRVSNDSGANASHCDARMCFQEAHTALKNNTGNSTASHWGKYMTSVSSSEAAVEPSNPTNRRL